MPKIRKNINTNKVKEYFLKLMNFIRPLSFPGQSLGVTSPSQPNRMIIQDGYGFIVLSGGMEFYVNIIKEILSVPFFQRHYSEASLETELNRLIVGYSIEPDQDKKNKLINAFEQNLKSKTKNWLIILPVEGIELIGVKSLKIGNCILRPYSIYQAKKLSFDNSNWELNVKKDIDSKIKFVGKKRITYIGLADINAYVEVNTSDERPVKVGILRLEEYLNILRLYIPVLESYQSNIYMGIKGLRPALHNIYYAKETNTTRHRISSFTIGKYETLSLNKQRIQKFKRLKFKEINAIYAKEIYELNDFEKRLRNSINSFGRGISELNPIEKFLSFMISIESLIGVRREGLAEHFCTVMNKVFIKSNVPLKTKKKQYQKFKDLYDIRSRFVHTGTDYINDRFVRSAQFYSLTLIFYMLLLESKISKEEELYEYLKDLKLK